MKDYQLEAILEIWPGSFDVDKKSDAIALVLPFESEEEAKKDLHNRAVERRTDWEVKGFRCRITSEKVTEI